MLFPTYPGLPEDGITVTFDRETALSRDDIAADHSRTTHWYKRVLI